MSTPTLYAVATISEVTYKTGATYYDVVNILEGLGVFLSESSCRKEVDRMNDLYPANEYFVYKLKLSN